MTLDHEDIEAIAQRVAELVAPRTSVGLVDARTLAVELGIHREWVYANARRLGAMRLGDGPKAALRFDVQRARAALEAGPSPDEPAARRRGRPRKSARPSGVKPIRERSTG